MPLRTRFLISYFRWMVIHGLTACNNPSPAEVEHFIIEVYRSGILFFISSFEPRYLFSYNIGPL